MYDIDLLMSSFQKELTKEALVPAIQRVLPAIGAGGGVGALAGAVGGGLYGTIRPYQEARRQGATPLEAAGVGLGGLVGGAAKGALLGTGLGAGGLGAAAALKRFPSVVPRLTGMEGPIGSAARFGQRQVHGFTGWVPEGGLGSIRGGAYGATERLKKTKISPKATPKDVEKAEKALKAAREAEEAGLTSIPGYVKGLASRPGETLRKGFTEQWHAMGPFGRGLVFGWPTIGTAAALAHKGEPGEPGRLERAGESLGTIGYGLGPLPLGPQLALAGALSGGLRRLGRKVESRKIPPSPPGPIEPAGGMTQPEEYVYTDRAMGNV